MDMLDYLGSKKARNDLRDYLASNDHCKKPLTFSCPKKLYKYSSINKYIINDLKNGFLTGTSPTEFNDLYDSSLFTDSFNSRKKLLNETNKMIKKLGYEESKIKIDKDKLKKQCKEVDEHNSSYYKDDFFVTSLTTLKDNILMWSHYADNNKGICIEYDFSTTKLSKYTYPIIYKRKPIDVTKVYIGRKNINLSLLISLINKFKEWEYEKEWRVIFYFHNNNSKRIELLSPKIKNIFLGKGFIDNFKEIKNLSKNEDDREKESKKEKADLIESLLKFVIEENITLKIARQKKNTFELFFEDIEAEEILNEVL